MNIGGIEFGIEWTKVVAVLPLPFIRRKVRLFQRVTIGGVDALVGPEPCKDGKHNLLEESISVDDVRGIVFYRYQCSECHYREVGQRTTEGIGSGTLELHRKGLWR